MSTEQPELSSGIDTPPDQGSAVNAENIPSEFDFHQKRYENMAERYKRRGKMQRIVDGARRNRWTHVPTPKDFAHVEALRQNAHFDLLKDPEYQAWQRNLRVVIDHILEKRDSSSEEARNRKIILLIMGGAMKSPYAVGQTIGLHDLGLGEAFSDVIGISGGAGPAAYFIGGKEQSLKGGDIWYNEASSPRFIDFHRVGQVMDVGYIIDVASQGERAVDFDAVRKSPTGLYVVATDAATHQAEIINAKTAKSSEEKGNGIVDAVHASMSAPLVYGQHIKVNDKEYIDGAFDPMPIQKIIDELHPDDILILPNTPFLKAESLEVKPGEWIIGGALKALGKTTSLASAGTLEKFMKGKTQLRKSLEFAQSQNSVNIGILWPPEGGLTNLGTNPDTVKAGIIAGARDLIKQFGGEQPREIGLYNNAQRHAANYHTRTTTVARTPRS